MKMRIKMTDRTVILSEAKDLYETEKKDSSLRKALFSKTT